MRRARQPRRVTDCQVAPFTTTFGRRWGGYLAVVLLIGLVGGIAMASIAAGRRTQASYPTFLASTNSADLTLTVYNANPASAAPGASLTASIARLADVKRVESLFSPTVVPLAPNGTPQLGALNSVSIVGSADGMFLDEDRVVAVEGWLANPNRADEVVMDAPAAQQLHVHVGEVIPTSGRGWTTHFQLNNQARNVWVGSRG